MAWDNYFQEIVFILIGLAITGGFGGVIGYFRKRTNCLEKLTGEVEDLRKRSYRIEKALIILVKMQEDAIEKSHPELQTDWEDIVKELLSSNGHRS